MLPMYAGPVVASFAKDQVTMSASPAMGALAAGVSWTIGDPPSGTFSGAVGSLYGQGIMAARLLGGRTLDVIQGVERRVTLMALDQGCHFLHGPPFDDQSFTSKIKDK